MDGERGETIRVRVIYSGRVQGVCFRATAYELAAGRPVVGYVRNRPDGSVELEAEGAEPAVRGLLDAIAAEFRANIREARETAVAVGGGEEGFEIRY